MSHDEKYFGLYRGVVVDNGDPKNFGRIKMLVPQVMGEEVTDWAWAVKPAPATVTVNHPEGGPETAPVISQPPAIKTGVFAMFEGGDPNFPLWIGVF
jgi:hypothetical protein